MTVPKAIDYVGALLPGGWPEVMRRNRALALDARRRVCAAVGTPPPAPDEMIGSLAAIVLPDGQTTEIMWRRPDPIQTRLYDDWHIEVPVMSWPAAPKRLIRLSAQLYNSPDHYVRLAEALTKELAAERSA
jgi:isopenicillin-N epimerase